MTPKLKAKELVNRYKQVEIYDTNEPDFYCKIKDVTSFNYTAKQCALIVVDEIINDWINNLKKLKEEEITIKHSLDEMMALSHSIKYWNEVKQEIENYENTN